ncbi:MAG TPA: ribosome biogenesis factor YjgA [Mariprofundaceae bacterium]|nr:ribosome biogenesis factor YjgA [Mariprofundaceae bacterium]
MSKLIDTNDLEGSRVERPNKSQQKREIQALHEVAEKLVGFSDAKLQSMTLPSELEKEIVAARSMKYGALKRQLKLITRLLREIPADSIIATVEDLDEKKSELDAYFHRLERWRDRLLLEGADALTEFMNTHPAADVSQIRQLIRNASKETTENKPPKSARALFKLLREIVPQGE